MDLNLEMPFSQSGSRYYKRILDIVGAAFGLIICLPVSIIIMILINLDTPGSPIYQQERIGKDGKRFMMYKFRTMCADNSELENQVLSNNPGLMAHYERFQKLVENPRLTQVGRILRRTSMDEIPQFLNILKGDMSLVGPRPFLAEQMGIYGDAYSYYVQMRPGLTGLWQVSGRNRLSFQDRVKLDVFYACNQSLGFDLRILFKTVVVVLEQDGAY